MITTAKQNTSIARTTAGLFFLLFSMLAMPAQSEPAKLEIDYTYSGNHGVDFSKLRGGPFRVAKFTDSRNLDNANLITDQALNNSDNQEGYEAEKPLADIIQNALVQGFLAGNASLVEADESKRLEGELIEATAQVISGDDGDIIRITMRVAVKLQSSGRTIWQTTLFGRGNAPASEGLKASVTKSLDILVRGLLRDDYFLNEIL